MQRQQTTQGRRVQGLLALAPSELVISFGQDCTVNLWDAAHLSLNTFGLVDRAASPHPPIVSHVSPCGRLSATCSANRHVCVWDNETLEPIRTMHALQGSRVKSAAFSGDCNLMAVVLFDSTVTLWDVSRDEAVWQPQQRGVRDKTMAHSGGVNGCFLSEVRPPETVDAFSRRTEPSKWHHERPSRPGAQACQHNVCLLGRLPAVVFLLFWLR
jgi:WD40 repeat protein